MCNVFHKDGNPKPIPSYGKGYKLFSNEEGCQLCSCEAIYQKQSEDGWIEWIPSFYSNYEGFCFFRRKRDAIRALKMWKRGTKFPNTEAVVKEIEYEMGIGECDEYLFVGGIIWRIALTKKFRMGKTIYK